MKRFILLIIVLTCITSCYVQKRNDMRWHIEHYDFGVPEKYDPFNKTEGGTKGVIYERNGWIIDTWEKRDSGKGYQEEYAPAFYFYEIIKAYHPNGMLQRRGKYTCGMAFGKWEYFDEKGNLIKVEDCDAPLEGVRIKREDVLDILEKAGVFNRRNGKHCIIDNMTMDKKDLTNPLKTDGTFYKILSGYIKFRFAPAEMEDGKEIKPPMWYVVYHCYDNVIEYVTAYQINAHTGQYVIKKSGRYVLDHHAQFFPIED